MGAEDIFAAKQDKEPAGDDPSSPESAAPPMPVAQRLFLALARYDLHHELSRLVVWPERTHHLVLHWRNRLQEHRDGRGIVLGQACERSPGHDRRELTAIRPFAGLNRRDDLGDAPIADTGFRIRGQVWAVENTESRNLEADFRAAEIAVHIGLAEKEARRVAVGAASDRHQVFAAIDLGLLSR